MPTLVAHVLDHDLPRIGAAVGVHLLVDHVVLEERADLLFDNVAKVENAHERALALLAVPVLHRRLAALDGRGRVELNLPPHVDLACQVGDAKLVDEHAVDHAVLRPCQADRAHHLQARQPLHTFEDDGAKIPRGFFERRGAAVLGHDDQPSSDVVGTGIAHRGNRLIGMLELRPRAQGGALALSDDADVQRVPAQRDLLRQDELLLAWLPPVHRALDERIESELVRQRERLFQVARVDLGDER
mmetsp:Transcript_29380/g.103577  ORF Transcript_29380/g.103577 Transcript_29380/m.103577 type:complete len:244 (-) Transcript_29380:103-834(-)